MLVVITVFVFLLASVSLAIGTLFRAQGELQDELAQASSVSRLAAQLRADAHLATTAEIVRDGDINRLRLNLRSESITYASHPRRIIRTVLQGETEVHREVFRLRDGTATDWHISETKPVLLTLTTSYAPSASRPSEAPRRELRVEASIGLQAEGAP